MELSIATGEVTAVKVYDTYVKSAVVPFAKACDDLDMKETGTLIVKAWEGVRLIIVLASRSKSPSLDEYASTLQTHLALTQNAVSDFQKVTLSRDLDQHRKAITEILGALAWVYMKQPQQQQLPAVFVKETLGSAEFWMNRLRKEFKGDAKHIAFCDAAKQVLVELVEYIQNHHKTGLTFNPRGVSIAEAAIRLTDEPNAEQDPKSPAGHKRNPVMGSVIAGGNIAGLMGELAQRKNADGTSAATGLKHVSRWILAGLENNTISDRSYCMLLKCAVLSLMCRLAKTNKRGVRNSKMRKVIKKASCCPQYRFWTRPRRGKRKKLSRGSQFLNTKIVVLNGSLKTKPRSL